MNKKYFSCLIHLMNKKQLQGKATCHPAKHSTGRMVEAASQPPFKTYYR